MEKMKLKDLSFPQLQALITDLGEKPFRAQQIYNWLYVQNVADFDSMKNLPKSLREKLTDRTHIDAISHELTKDSPSGDAKKFLFKLDDGHHIETVLMYSDHGRTICISTQVGCPIDCQFCATGLMGLIRNLTAGEILDQFLQIERLTNERITNIVVMGMGEPMLNYDNLMQALDILSDDNGRNMAKRQIVVSSSGVIPQIERFIADNRKYRLAISLNATTDEVRNQIMPLNRKWPIKMLFETVRKYTANRRNRITFEYVLLKGVNDTIEDARRLRDLVKHERCILNIIPYNATFSVYTRPDEETIMRFYRELDGLPIPVTIRWSKGVDIDAACGQLVTREGKAPLKNEKRRAAQIGVLQDKSL